MWVTGVQTCALPIYYLSYPRTKNHFGGRGQEGSQDWLTDRGEEKTRGYCATKIRHCVDPLWLFRGGSTSSLGASNGLLPWRASPDLGRSFCCIQPWILLITYVLIKILILALVWMSHHVVDQFVWCSTMLHSHTNEFVTLLIMCLSYSMVFLLRHINDILLPSRPNYLWTESPQPIILHCTTYFIECFTILQEIPEFRIPRDTFN